MYYQVENARGRCSERYERYPDEKEKCPAGPELFCISNVGATRFEGEDDELVIWQDIATLQVKACKCARILHQVNGTILAVFEDSDNTAAVADFEFRIIDETGHIVCTQRVRYAGGFPEDVGDTEVRFPFSFTCCDHVNGCDERITYRLQADLLDERLAENNDVWVTDVNWSAIAFSENERKLY